jgi:hypothetical protein
MGCHGLNHCGTGCHGLNHCGRGMNMDHSTMNKDLVNGYVWIHSKEPYIWFSKRELSYKDYLQKMHRNGHGWTFMTTFKALNVIFAHPVQG